MTEWKCPFCGSAERLIKSDYIELKEDGTYGPIMDYCCLAQKQNARYVASSYGPDNKPDIDEVSKW